MTSRTLVYRCLALFCCAFAHAAHSEDLCAAGQIAFNPSNDALTVHFPDYFPIRLVTSKDCDVRWTCTYDVAIVSGNQTSVHVEGLEIPDLCAEAEQTLTEFGNHAVTQYSPTLNDEFDLSRKASLVIATTSGWIEISRTDFAVAPGNIGWLSPLVVGGGSLLMASPAASTFHVSVMIDEE